MLPDYYQILGVSLTANDAEIAKAFRERAVECHPDRGGSHEAMKALNEAWTILSNPETRRRYDKARLHQDNAAAQSAAAADTAKAAAAAGIYPRVWSDFVKAEYGQTEPIWGIPFPTVRNSLSGYALIAIGGFFGFLFAALISSVLIPSLWQTSANPYLLFLHVLIGGAPGAWLAIWLHTSLRHEIIKSGRTSNSGTGGSDDRIIVSCPKCGKKLRVPDSGQCLSVTCPSCRAQFTHQASITEQPESSTGFIAAGYICGLLALLLVPPAFGLAGLACGIVNVAKGRPAHGISQIVLAVSCGILGFIIGMMAG